MGEVKKKHHGRNDNVLCVAIIAFDAQFSVDVAPITTPQEGITTTVEEATTDRSYGFCCFGPLGFDRCRPRSDRVA